MFRSSIIFVIFLFLQSPTSKGEDQQFLKSDLAPSKNYSEEQHFMKGVPILSSNNSRQQPLPSSQEPAIRNTTTNIDNICANNLWKIACSVYERTSNPALLVSYSMHCFGLSSFSHSSTTLNAMCQSVNEITNVYNNYLWIAACEVYEETLVSNLLVSHTMSAFQLTSFSFNSATLDAICDGNKGSRVTNVNICDSTWRTACAIYQRSADSRSLVSYAMKVFNLGSLSYDANTLNIMCEDGILEVSNEKCYNSWKVACEIHDETIYSYPLVSLIMLSYQLTSFSYSETVLNIICESIIETISTNTSISVKSMTFWPLIIIGLLPVFARKEIY